MELVDGPTLADRVADGPIPIDEAISIAKQIADALEAAHEQGVIHRDLKPANIKVRPDGAVKVLDFGLAKALEPASVAGADATASPTITTPAMTRMGMILGTAAYMSPEQAKGRPADKRSDVWAFGCVLYEMLSGRRAFEGEDVADTLAAVMRGEPDWSALPPDLRGTLRELVQRCLEKDRRRRIGDLSVARFVLDQPTSFAPTSREAAPRRRRWKFAAAIAAATLLSGALVGAAAWRLKPTGSLPPVARFSFAIPEGQQLSTVNQSVAISPDGTQLVYVANRQLFLRSLSDFDARALAGTEDRINVNSPTFSPDGRSIAFHSVQEQAVKRIAVSSGAAVTICPSGLLQLYGMTWDSSGIVFSAANRILRCSPNGGTPEQLATVQSDEVVHGPQLLLDGAALLFTIAKLADGVTRWDTAQIVVQTIASGARQVIVSGGTDARYLPTGHLVYSARGIVFGVPFDPLRQTVTGAPVPMVEGVLRSQAGITGAVLLATSGTGTLFYVPGPTGTDAELALALADRAGALTRLAAPPGPYDLVRASRDGTRLAIGTDDGREAIVWIYEVNGKTAMRRLTFGGQNRLPVWSPDGRHVAFQSDREGDLGLFAQNADGTGVVERLTKAQQDEAHVPESWSPDGRQLLFSVRREARFSLQLLSLGDKKAAPYGGVESTQPIGAVFSPDGRWVAYTFAPEGALELPNRGVYVQPFPATGARYQVPKRQLDFHPVWEPKGTQLLYVPSAASRQMAAVSVTTQPPLTFGNPVILPAEITAGRTGVETRAHDVMPDGRFVGLVPASQPDSSGAASPVSVEMRVVLNWFEELKARVPIQ